MAEAANKASVEADIRPADYRSAVQRIRSIDAKKDKIAGLNGDIADIWAKVEGHKVNKAAGKTFQKLDAMEPEDRLRFMRDLNGLCDAAGWPDQDGDLVDQARGEVVQMRMGRGGDDDDNGGGENGGGEEPGDDDDNGPGPQPEPEVKAKRAAPPADALAAARKRIGGGERKTPGDDRDLSGHAGQPLH